MTMGESVHDDLYDENVDDEAEEKMLEKYKQERLQEMFPDEIDTPRDVAARIRLVNKSKISMFLFKISVVQNYVHMMQGDKHIVPTPEALIFCLGR